jgi:hypothetical protein
MHIFFLFIFIVLCVLFRREMRALLLILLITFGVMTWWTTSYWVDRYDHWVDCGRPHVGVCIDYDKQEGE